LLTSDENYLWANPPFTMIEKVLTKIVLDKSRVVLVTPDWGHTGSNGQWRKLLDRLTTDHLELPAKPLYVRSLDNRLMEKPCWNTLVSVVDATKISIRPNELSPSVCRWVQKLNRGKTFRDLVQCFVGQLSNRCDASIQAVC
jgi:hypothetical protein